jgi:hypothetical protein
MVAIIVIACPLGGVVVPPDSARVIDETPLTTVMVSVVVVDVSKLTVSVGVNIAVRLTLPRDAGVHEHVAVVDAAAAEPQPERVDPPSRKFTEPARETVAAMVTAPPRAALVAAFGNEIEMVVDAFATEMVICLLPVCDPESVATTFCVYVPAGVVAEAETTPLEIVTPVGVDEREKT